MDDNAKQQAQRRVVEVDGRLRFILSQTDGSLDVDASEDAVDLVEPYLRDVREALDALLARASARIDNAS